MIKTAFSILQGAADIGTDVIGTITNLDAKSKARANKTIMAQAGKPNTRIGGKGAK